MNYIQSQIENFNILTFVLIVLFNIILSHANMTRLLKQQSKELYNNFEEIKDEIRERK